MRSIPSIIVSAILVASCGASLSQLPSTRALKRAPSVARAPAVDPSTLYGKLIFGYQGWFACPGDGSPLGAWDHWFRGAQASAAALRVDMWPDVSELDPAERCPTPLTLPGGRPAELYSAYNTTTVERHFRWMREYELPGVFLQRFTAPLHDDAVLGFRDAVARNVRGAAEANGRVFAIMYDISGHPPRSLIEDVERDWRHLVDELRITESPRYLRHRGRPVLAIWGFGFRDRAITPSHAEALIEFFKNNPDPRYRMTLLGGVPARWRTLTQDSQSDADWARVYRSLDIVSPWTIGRIRDLPGVDQFYEDEVKHDLIETRTLGIDYMPVLFPGFSWHNMNRDAPINAIPRRGGRFYWRQVERALAAGSTMMYGAMFDEVDEGTAMFKVAASKDEVPADVSFVTLNLDGETLPTDWYLRLAREAQRRLRSAAARHFNWTGTSPAGPIAPVAGLAQLPHRLPAHVGPHVTDLGDACGHCSQREGSRTHLPALHLFPRARCRYRCTGLRAHGVRRRERRTVAVPSGVDENAPTPIDLAELLRQMVRIALDQHSTDAMREARDSPHIGLAVQRNDDVKSLGAGGLHPACQSELGQEIAQRQCGGAQHVQVLVGRIEIEDADVRPIQIRRPRRPYVRRDAVLVDDP